MKEVKTLRSSKWISADEYVPEKLPGMGISGQVIGYVLENEVHTHLIVIYCFRTKKWRDSLIGDEFNVRAWRYFGGYQSMQEYNILELNQLELVER